MKNLKLFSEVSQNIHLHSTEEVVQFAAYDIDQSRLFLASSTNFVYVLQVSSFQNGRALAKNALPVEGCRINLNPGEFITAFEYLVDNDSLLIGTSLRLLLVHNEDGNVTELVGNKIGGIKFVSPSPSGSLLGLITGSGQLLVITYYWNIEGEISIFERELAEVPQDDLSVNCGEISISWRGDGEYLATMGEVYESGCIYKKIKIWESESCTLHSSSETKDFMNGILEWMPSGAKIATSYKSKSDDGCPSIAFFERNGLERNSFRIGEPGDTLQTLKWNYASDLLAGVVSCKTHCAIRVWFFSNNHWYLKHEIRYPKESGVMITWDKKKLMQLICWTLGGQVTVCNFMWVTAVMEDSTAFVVDNSKILVTPLTFSLMPPPMYLFSLRFSSAVRDIAYYSRNSKSCLAVFLSDGNLSFVEFPAPNNWIDLEETHINVEISDFKIALGSFVHLLWLDVHSLLCVSAYGSTQDKCHSSSSYETELYGSYLQEIEVVSSEDLVPDQVTYSGFKASVAFQTPLESQVIALAWNPSKRASAFLEFEDGKVLDYVSRSGIIEARINEDSVCFPSSFPLLRVAQVGADGVCKPLICGLDDMDRLYINGKSLCNNCSSFSFYSELANEVVTHLIILTKQDFLFIIDTKDVLQGEVALGTMYFVIDGRKRDEENISYVNIWERGATVIGVLIGNEAAVILQTMRGNLECIYPRKLVLSSIMNALAQQRFKDALNLVRRHRIDFNVIVDLYGWQAFLQSAVEFVEQVNNLNHITEFVCAMKNEDITETLYKKFFISRKQDIVKGGCCGNKVTSVLQAIRKALEKQLPENPQRELCILTTLARSDPPAIEESLLRIKSIREMELLNSSDDSRKKSSPSAEEALKHLVWLLDSEAVFDAALGLYDLNLAAIVALNSQRDPKEFLPYLQELERMSVPLMHYNIDIKLQRFDSALVNIVSAGDDYFPDCMNLMKKNPQLFPLGLQLITDPEKKQVVLEAWGDHLTDEKCLEDAATTYLCCYRLEKASKAYRECGDWSGVLRVGALMKLGKDEILKLASELCEEVSALGKPGEAAKIALEYCKDISGGISLLINAREWEEALRVAYLQHTSDDFISMVKNSSLECASGLVNEFKESIEKVGKYLTRYLAVRQRRLLLVAKLKSEERSVIDLDDDTASEASSNLSGMSAYTFGTRRGSAASVSSSTATSTKARDLRRQRKSGKIRAGSAGEETALVEHLKGMHMTEGGKRELKSLLICLVTLGEKESAQKLQQTAENFQVAQIAAVELADDTVSSEIIDEEVYSLERYVKKTRSTAQHYSDAFSWMLKVFFFRP